MSVCRCVFVCECVYVRGGACEWACARALVCLCVSCSVCEWAFGFLFMVVLACVCAVVCP